MTVKDIHNLAAGYGWEVSLIRNEDAIQLHFSRTTLSGVPFSFSVDIGSGRVKTLFRELLSFVDALEPERCAMDWMVKSGVVSPLLFDRAVTDMEDIRRQAWLLIYDFGVKSGLMPVDRAAFSLSAFALSSAIRPVCRL